MSAAPSPPGPKGHWVVGNLPEFRRDLLGFFTHCARTYGDLVALKLGPRLVHLASHPDFVEQVLVTENRRFGKSYVFELLRPVLGNGLLNSEGEFWLRQRRLMQPAFSKASVNGYADIISAQTSEVIARWHDGQQIDLHYEMNRLALGIVGKALMDIDLSDVSNEIFGPINSAMRDFSNRFEGWFNPPMWIPTPRNLRAKRNVRQLDRVVNRIIHQRRESGRDRGDLLSKLIAARDEVDQTGMTDRQLRDEVMTLFLAGHETSANALTWTWFLLSQNPQSEERLFEELRRILGSRPPQIDDVPKLMYTDAVVKESLRLYPPAFAFSRRVLADVKIGGYHIPADSAVIMSQWVIHRDSRWWAEPEQFRPERWLSGQTQPRPDYAYFPFGAGPRGCIGNLFAMLELVLVLAIIAPRFRFELLAPEKVKPWPSVTLRPASGIPGLVRRRDGERV
ncbi:MAG: cytochrome P450 [Pirellulales bacterium]|nr:cytochrome P450 [Pirellulales bacterium]